jgi:hypothetical protein
MSVLNILNGTVGGGMIYDRIEEFIPQFNTTFVRPLHLSKWYAVITGTVCKLFIEFGVEMILNSPILITIPNNLSSTDDMIFRDLLLTSIKPDGTTEPQLDACRIGIADNQIAINKYTNNLIDGDITNFQQGYYKNTPSYYVLTYFIS